MASKQRENLLCPICQEMYENPVILTCEHSFCIYCLKTNWADRKTTECPICKRRYSKELPPLHFALKMECDELRTLGSELVCSLHAQKHFFCLDELQLVCSICRDSETHKHRFQLTEEAGQESKKSLQDILKPLKKKLRLIHEVEGSCDQTANHIKYQAESTARRIKEGFKKLHLFLEEEEEARLNVLREEEEQKNQMMKEKISVLSKHISDLSGILRSTDKELKAQFLLNYKETVEKIQQHPLPDDPGPISGALINEARHLGNLSFNVWNKMKEMVSYTPVILDPNTAHPKFSLSENLTSLRKGEGKQELPDNPERIDHLIFVVGSESFISGCHSWEVEVGDNGAYVLGVLAGSDRRKGVILSRLWRLMFCNGEHKSISPSDTGSDISVMENPRRIRVLLDCDGG
ncbi:nuclear factor 7, ovary-like [Girardinichthys multiradiatus]|uniref:nuclear factor 7, ovary-like n=1 Tax=Girardinichthys multiradiatus TaxID=208333 RepID=UPI001FAD864B|nr:nuclear factor 7, ovary-like [Girardinichthys multiradiatus]